MTKENTPAARYPNEFNDICIILKAKNRDLCLPK